MMQQIDQPIVNITMPAKHMEIKLTRAQKTILAGSRGSLKTTLGLAMYFIDCIYDMPRSTGALVCLSYEHFETNTLRPLLKGWANLGYRMDEHFVMDKKPPDGWPRAYDYNGETGFKRTFCWHNGTFIQIVSLSRVAPSNAISAQFGGWDEFKFVKQEQYNEVAPIFRPSSKETEEIFKNSSLYLSNFMCTDKLADPAEIEWILKQRDDQDPERIQNCIIVQTRVNELEAILSICENKKDQALLKREIFDLKQILLKERRGLVHFPEINCYDVLPLLGQGWLDAAKLQARTERVIKIALENEDPVLVGQSFYPAWNEKVHLYDTKADEDIDYNAPLIISCDYQHSVAPMPVAQLSVLPGKNKVSLNYIDYVYGLHPIGLSQTVEMFCDRYKNHQNKVVHYCYDHTAIGKRIEADEYCKIVMDVLIDKGWTVIDHYTGQAPSHFMKYSDTKDWMEHGKGMEDELEIRMHKRRCKNLNQSIKNSGAKTSRGKTEKDKQYEDVDKFPDLDQSTTTHGSDAFDTLNDAVIKLKEVTADYALMPIGFGSNK